VPPSTLITAAQGRSSDGAAITLSSSASGNGGKLLGHLSQASASSAASRAFGQSSAAAGELARHPTNCVADPSARLHLALSQLDCTVQQQACSTAVPCCRTLAHPEPNTVGWMRRQPRFDAHTPPLAHGQGSGYYARLAPMKYSRSDHHVIAVGSMVYIMGGTSNAADLPGGISNSTTVRDACWPRPPPVATARKHPPCPPAPPAARSWPQPWCLCTGMSRPCASSCHGRRLMAVIDDHQPPAMTPAGAGPAHARAQAPAQRFTQGGARRQCGSAEATMARPLHGTVSHGTRDLSGPSQPLVSPLVFATR
jgi:hypothetical protein